MSNLSAARIRQPLLQGRQAVAALWWPCDWFDAATRARHLIACWQPGATAHRFPQGDLLRFASPLEMNCEQLTGWPLRQEGRALCSAPCSDRERAALPAADLCLVLGADVLPLRLRDAVPLDPAAWLAVRHLVLHETYDCKTTLDAPVLLEPLPRELRAVLGDAVAPASEEQRAFLEALQQASKQRGKAAPDAAPAVAPETWALRRPLIFLACCIGILALAGSGLSGNVRGALIGALLAVLVLLILWLQRRATSWLITSLSDDAAGGSVAATPQARGTSLPGRQVPRPLQRWRQWLARFAVASQVARLLGRAQARYLRHLLDMFDAGNLGEALRHAIPLGGSGAHGSLGQAFGTPRPRNSLELSRSLRPAASISLAQGLEEHLRRLYRKAFEKLDREQRIDEAVFVLAELLNARQEALDYLEKHQRFAQAAELALAWDHPPDVIVRLHCLAGNWRRAIAVARRDGAFANAVLQLEKRWPDAARRLREEWGMALTQQGDWLGAVEAVWPVAALRERAAQWLLTAEAGGSRLAARALVQRALLLPDTLDRHADYFLELQRDRTLWRERAALAEALLSLRRGPGSQQLAAIVLPGLLADHAAGQRRFERDRLLQLLQLSNDVLLQADLPSNDWPAAQVVPLARRSVMRCIDAPAAGVHVIVDAVPLHDQRYLIALGEAGARIVDATGKTRAHFAVPAQRLVLASSRQVALLLARRESLWRVSRLDLVQQTIVDLGLAEFDRFCTEFDGINWTIARQNRLLVLDTQSSLREVVWQVSDLPGPVGALISSSTFEQMVITTDAAPQLWLYRLPERRLLSREPLPPWPQGVRLLNANPASLLCVTVEQADEEICLRWQVRNAQVETRFTSTAPKDLNLRAAGDWLVLVVPTATGYTVRWLLLTTGVEHARVEWPADCIPQLRTRDHELVVFDAAGRLLALDVDTGLHQSLAVR